MHWAVWQWSGVLSSCLCRSMVRTQWPDSIMVSWFALSKLPSFWCCAFGVCRIKLTLSSRMQLPCFKMGSGSRLFTSGACTCVAKRSSSWIWTTNCQAHRRPCTFQVTVDQVVDDHACCRADDQRDQKDRHLVVELIAHHRLAEDQDRAFLGLVDWYVQSQGHHWDQWWQRGHWKKVLRWWQLMCWALAHHWAR